MIRINLLAEKKKKKKKIRITAPSNLFFAIVIANVAALLIAGLAAFALKHKVAQLNVQSESNKTAIAALSKKIGEIKKIEKLNKELEQRGNTIEILRKNQAVPVRLLDEVSSIIPEGVWLNSLAYRDMRVVLEGYAFTNIDIVAYIDNLKKSASFSDVYLEESREAEVEKVKVYKFKLNFKIKV